MNQLPKLTVKEIFNETLKFFNLEKGIGYTFLSMLKNPLKTVNTYLHENRKKYTNPLQYVLFSVAVYMLIMSFHPSFKSLIESSQKTNKEQFSLIEKKANIQLFEPYMKAQEVYFSTTNILYFFVIPVISLATFWFFKKKYNYAENLAIHSYNYGTANWASALISIPTFFIDNSNFMFFLMAVSFGLTCYIFKKVYQTNWVKSILTAIVTLVIFFIIVQIYISILTIYFMVTVT